MNLSSFFKAELRSSKAFKKQREDASVFTCLVINLDQGHLYFVGCPSVLGGHRALLHEASSLVLAVPSS